MALCPICKTEQAKRASGGRCPNCKSKVEVHEGYWFPAGTGSPNLKILKHFEDLISERLSNEQGKSIVFQVPKKSIRYKRELVQAGKLLEMADFDLQLTLDSITLLFKDPKFAWKNYTTLLWMNNEFPVSLAIMQARIEEKKKLEQKQNAYINELLRSEDIFS